jgi:asparagine synthase (glutamine-hydrolysing)
VSGLLAVVGQASAPGLEAALARSRALGGDREQVWSGEDLILAVTRKEWELGADFSGQVLVLEGPDLVIVADCSLYDRKRLARELSTAGQRARDDTPSHYIEAAYRAWGPGLVRHLSGDYAFALWDRRQHRVVAARDPIGARPLFHTSTPGGLAIGSSCRALAELRGGALALNLDNLGGLVAGLAWSNGVDTAYEGVDRLPPGHLLISERGRTRLECFWSPRAAPDRRPTRAAEGAEELRRLLGAAVSKRLGSGVNTVWMSGGRDSTAVFASGQTVLEPGDRARLRPVSISYPVGDPGREDRYIKQVAERWNAEVHWIESDGIPLLDGLEDRAAQSDEPPAHLYELWNRSLARGTRAADSRIALDGGGGDQLFQVSDIVLADMLRTGRWLEFARLARSKRERGWKYVARLGVLPLLPSAVLAALGGVSGRTVPRHYLERALTGWMRPEFVARRRVRERDLAVLRQVHGSSLAHTESMLFLSLPLWSWGGAFMRGALLQEGVEVRSPLLDLDLVEFALGRPVAERADGAETKLLLRRAMRGLLPAEVLAPRAHRTGMTVGFSRLRMREAYPDLLARLFEEPVRLAELGIVDPAALRAAADRYLAGEGNDFLRVNLFHTMKTEFWLRGLDRQPETREPGASTATSATKYPAA